MSEIFCSPRTPDFAGAPAPSPHPPVLILGSSTRAAAQSAIRAGLSPCCADLFADRDLHACAHVIPVANYPAGLVEAARTVGAMPWFYTGGLENHPEIVHSLSQTHPLWGNGASTLYQIRDPWTVAAELQAAGLPALCVWPRDAAPPPASGDWIQKPLAGAGGRGIQIYDRSRSFSQTDSGTDDLEPVYYQERRDGLSLSALFVAFPEQVVLVGVTQ
ncbi:MAG: hypothetical protein JSS02_35615, partial [Planctomycetes bacterium]|nr:hypothetical protein [Planctomycetota bacterium]